jgi:hypothetical protein
MWAAQPASLSQRHPGALETILVFANFQSALGLITVGLTDLEAVSLCVISNPCALTIEGDCNS